MAYAIVATHHYYGPSLERRLVDDGATFATQADARAWIATAETTTYHLRHNESQRPDYRVRRVDSLPAYLACYL